MDKIRINKITVNVNKQEDSTTVSFYKTNDLIGTFSEDELGLPTYSEVDNVSVNTYITYCRDYAIKLLQADAFPGFYYEPKSEGQKISYTESSFKLGIHDYINRLIDNRYEYNIPMSEVVNITERYNNKNIKTATAEVDVVLKNGNRFTVFGEIKSGQLCKPKMILYKDTEMPFNITSINKINKS